MSKNRFKKIISVALSASLLLGSLPLWGGGKAEAATDYKITNFLGSYDNTDKSYLNAVTDEGKVVQVSSANPKFTEVTGLPKDVKVQDYADSYGYGIFKDDLGRSWYKGLIQGTESPVAITDWSVSRQLGNIDQMFYGRSGGNLKYTKTDGTYWEGKRGALVAQVSVPDTSGVKLMSAHNSQTFLVMNSGDVYVNGIGNYSGVPGQSENTLSTFTKIPGLSNIVKLSVSDQTGAVLAIDKDGATYGWGRSGFGGQEPQLLSNVPKAVDVVAGYNGSLILTESDGVYGYSPSTTEGFNQSSETNPSGYVKFDLLESTVGAKVTNIFISGYTPYIVTDKSDIYSWGSFGGSTKVTSPVKVAGAVFVGKTSLLGQVKNVDVVPSATGANVSWELHEGASSYVATVGMDVVYQGSASSFEIKDLMPNQSYSLSVWAVTSDGLKGESYRSTFKTLDGSPYKETYKVGDKQVTPGSIKYFQLGGDLYVTAGDNTLIRNGVIPSNDNGWSWAQNKSYEQSDAIVTITNYINKKLSTLEKRALDERSGYKRTLIGYDRSIGISGTYPAILSSYQDVIAGSDINGIKLSTYFGFIRDTRNFSQYTSLQYTPSTKSVELESSINSSHVNERSKGLFLTVNLSKDTVFSGKGTQYDPFLVSDVVETPEKLSAPSNFKVTTEAKSISASWDTVSGAQDYTLKINGVQVYKGAVPNYTYTNVEPNTNYTVEVFGNKNGSEAGESSILSVKTKEEFTKLPAPINFGINVVNKNSLVTSWNPVAGADTYTLVVNGEIAYTGPASATSKVFFDLLPNTTYTVEVYATRGGVDGDRATDTATTPEAEIKLEAPTTPVVVNTEEGSVKISWNATNGALLYKVFRNGVEVGSVSSPSYTDKNTVEGDAYLYTVKAFDGTKTSEASPFVLVTVTAKSEVPKAPDNPRNFRLVSDEHSVTASWDAVVGADTYQITINGLEVYNGSDLSYTYSNLPEKTEYRVEISAINSVGKSGTQLDTIWTKDPLKLPAAKNPKAETTHNEATISWDPIEGATSYWVRINNDVVYEGPDTFVTAKGLGSDRPYTVYIFGKNDTVEGEPATLHIVTKKVPVELGKPTNLVAVPKESYIKLTWDAVAGATEYIVRQGNAIVYQGKLTTFTQTDLPSGTTYNYEVVAVNGDVQSEAATTSATTLVVQLPYPANFRVLDLKWNKIVLDWDEVEGADEYLITRDGMSIGVPQNTGWSEDSNSIWPGATYTYKVAAYRGGVLGKTTQKVVTIPEEPVQGQAPLGELTIKATRVQHDRVGLSWNRVAGATYYEVFQDTDNNVWSGSLNTITDPNVGPQEMHTYKVVAGNEWGTLDSNVITITTPAAPQSIIIAPSEPMEGTITFNYKFVEGAVMYVERNPQTKAVPLGDGSYHVTYSNEATGEVRDEGIVTPVNGMLQFSETGIDPGKNYHYDITAVRIKADGSEEVIAKEEVNVTTPSDGSGVTVPGTIVDPGTTPPTNPGNGGGTTPPITNPGNGGSSGGSTDGSTGGSTGGPSAGGSTTNPATEDKDSVPGTVVVPGDKGEVITPVVPEINFTDISGNFAEEAIKNLTASGILKGYSDSTFGPSKKITRAEFAIMLTRAMGYEDSGKYQPQFKDFEENSWYAGELLTALDSGVTKGFTDGTYRPNVFIPREQAAVMVANILEKNNFKDNLGEMFFMDDTDIVVWATSSVYLLKSHKIVEGQNNFFYPKREITRGEAAVIIYRTLNALKS